MGSHGADTDSLGASEKTETKLGKVVYLEFVDQLSLTRSLLSRSRRSVPIFVYSGINA